MSWSVYAWFRILIPEVVDKDISRVLYLDCDTIVNTNLDYIFNLDLSGKAIAAVVDAESSNHKTFDRLNYPIDKGYVCSGVLLLNLDYWSEHSISEKLQDFGKKNSNLCIFFGSMCHKLCVSRLSNHVATKI